MVKPFSFLLRTSLVLTCVGMSSYGNCNPLTMNSTMSSTLSSSDSSFSNENSHVNSALNTKIEESTAFASFTGKIIKNKVRMRLQPSLESPILEELKKDDLLVISAATEDFYEVLPPAELKAYVYRKFVLDDTIEGMHVNVRLEPNLDAPVIIQLNSGDPVEGVVSAINSKWLEISTPKAARFYVAKDFVEKIGDPSLIEKLTKQRENLNHLLESTLLAGQAELEKPYQEIHLERIFQNLNKIIADKNNSSEQIEKAVALLTLLQDKYLAKKIAFLNERPTETLASHSFQENQNNHQKDDSENCFNQTREKNPITAKMNCWIPVESMVYQEWLSKNPEKSEEEFYQQEQEQAVVLKGLLEPYDRSVKNKPGDYLLVNSKTRLPIAYLYSIKVNLQELIGEEVLLEVVARQSNNFAFPAYYVLKVDPSN